MNYLNGNKGVSGWLSPNGTFIPVEYGMHDSVARTYEKNERITPVTDRYSDWCAAHGERLLELLGYVKFVFRRTGAREIESFVFFPQQFGCMKDITADQIEWIENNYDKMSQLQRNYCQCFIRYSTNDNSVSYYPACNQY